MALPPGFDAPATYGAAVFRCLRALLAVLFTERLGAEARRETLLVRLEELPLFDHLYLVSRAWRVVGQHGAGLAHMIWAREDAALVEVVPSPCGVVPGKVTHAAFFRGICRTFGLRWGGVPQPGNHAEVEPERVLKALAAPD